MHVFLGLSIIRVSAELHIYDTSNRTACRVLYYDDVMMIACISHVLWIGWKCVCNLKPNANYIQLLLPMLPVSLFLFKYMYNIEKDPFGVNVFVCCLSNSRFLSRCCAAHFRVVTLFLIHIIFVDCAITIVAVFVLVRRCYSIHVYHFQRGILKMTHTHVIILCARLRLCGNQKQN